MENGVKKFASDSKTITRRERVIERLEAQLKSGTKTAKKSGEIITLTTHDVNRIQKEISTLKSRLV